jgi:hypothetical protein
MSEAGKVDINYYLSVQRKRIELSEPKEAKEIPLCEKRLWRAYRNKVWKITKKQNLKKLSHFKDRGFYDYHLDHKVSIWYGYKNKLSPDLIGGIDNLEFIYWRENLRKAKKCNFENSKCLQTIAFV